MNEIVYFLVASGFAWFTIYLIIKLIDKVKLRRLKKRFPEGTETIAKPVGRLDEVPVSAKQVIEKTEQHQEIIEKLLEKQPTLS